MRPSPPRTKSQIPFRGGKVFQSRSWMYSQLTEYRPITLIKINTNKWFSIERISAILTCPPGMLADLHPDMGKQCDWKSIEVSVKHVSCVLGKPIHIHLDELNFPVKAKELIVQRQFPVWSF